MLGPPLWRFMKLNLVFARFFGLVHGRTGPFENVVVPGIIGHKQGHATVTDMTGDTIKTVLEDVADNLFNPDPYYQQGGDMVRVGGLQYSCNPLGSIGSRIGDLRLGGKLIESGKTYKVPVGRLWPKKPSRLAIPWFGTW